jgi:hypothetical protein
VVSAGAFIGELSYSAVVPVGIGRPDTTEVSLKERVMLNLVLRRYVKKRQEATVFLANE